MLLSKEELEKLGVLHPEIAEVSTWAYSEVETLTSNKRQYLEKNPRPKMSLTDPATMRKGMEMMEQAINKKLPPVPAESEFYHEIAMRDGYMSTLKIHKPASSTPGPLIVLAFGGGFVGGTIEQLTRTARALKDIFGATVINISYRLAPEYKFPFAQHDTQDSLKWIADNATGPLLSSDPRRGFLMGGVSAGAALTAAFSRIFQEEPLAFPLTGQWLCVPSVMDVSNVPEKYKPYHISAQQFADGEFFSTETREWLYKLVQHDVDSPLRYAINSTTPVAGQPRTYFQVDGMDPLRDDGLVYEEMLKEAGVETKLDVYDGCPHGHFAAFPTLEISKKAEVDVVVGFGWLLGREVGREKAAEALGL